MRKLSQGGFEFSRSHNQDAAEQDIKIGMLIPVSPF